MDIRKMDIRKMENEYIDGDLSDALEARFGNVDIDKILNETVKRIKEGKEKYLMHKEVFENARKAICKKI